MQNLATVFSPSPWLLCVRFSVLVNLGGQRLRPRAKRGLKERQNPHSSGCAMVQNGNMLTGLSRVSVARTRILASLLNEGHVCTCPEHNYGVHKYHPRAILLLLIPKFELLLKVTVLLRQGLHTMSRKVSNLAPSMVTVHLLGRCPPYSSCVQLSLPAALATQQSSERRRPLLESIQMHHQKVDFPSCLHLPRILP
jgi:hypothetical protein